MAECLPDANTGNHAPDSVKWSRHSTCKRWAVWWTAWFMANLLSGSDSG